MNPSAYPPPPGACVGSVGALFSAACGAAMQPLCSGVTTFQGAAVSALANPQSNCAVWAAAVAAENVITGAGGSGVNSDSNDNGTGSGTDSGTDSTFTTQSTITTGTVADGTPYVDAAMRAYCADYPNAPECGCLAFSVTAGAWCSSSDCRGSAICALDEIAQGQGPGGEVEVVQFAGGCDPYPCWLEACYAPNALLTSDFAAIQRSAGACKPWCIDESTGSTFSGQIPPLPPGSFALVGSGIMTRCGNAVVGPTPFMPPLTVQWAANAYMQLPLGISNVGDLPLELSLTTLTAPWAQLWPLSGGAEGATLHVPARTVRPVLLVADQASLSSMQAQAPGGSFSAPLAAVFTYPDSEGDTQSWTADLTVAVFPPSPPIQLPAKAVPAAAVVATVSLLAVALLALVIGWFVTRQVRAADAAAGGLLRTP